MSTDSIPSQMPVSCGDNLVLRLACPDDVAELIDFNTRIFDERITDWTADVAGGRHPTVQANDFTVVEDIREKKIVSSVCLISQTWSYGGIPFQVGRPELVATDPEYRRRGLVRKQFDAIHARSAAKGELLQVITGVDWFYRQFGYDMGVKLWGSRCVNKMDLPSLKEGESEGYRLRPVTSDDHGFIRDVHDQAGHGQLFAARRSPEEWEYEFTGRSKANTRRREWLILEDTEGERLGYVQYLPCLPLLHLPLFRISQVELKAGVGYLNVMPSLLRGLWEKALALFATGELPCKELQGLELALERDHPLYRAIPKNLVRDLKPSPWYIRIPDRVAFLRKIRPALENHLVGTVAEGYSGELKLNFFRSGIQLVFEHGRISAIENWQPGEVWQGDARLPDASFLQLVCGWHRFQEIAGNVAECWATHEASVLLDCLFPSFHGKAWVLA
jgi:Acetyltransferase (GNAT) domain